MNYGSDFKLDKDGDIIFTANEDISIEDTVRLIAQDLKEEASIPYGSVSWDKTAGSYFFKMLNNADFENDDVTSELERLALKDPRIDASTVAATIGTNGKFKLVYRPLGYIKEEHLLFDLNNLFLGEHNE